MTRILHVVASIDPKLGGVSTAIITMIDGLKQYQADSVVVSLDDPAANHVASSAFTIHPLGPGKGPWCYSHKLIPWLVDYLPEFDIVIIHGLWLFNGYAVEKAMRRLKSNKKIPRVFVMPHGMLDPYFQKAASRKIKALRNWLYWKAIERKVINHTDGILFTCEEERRLAKQTFTPYRPKQELVIGLGVDKPPAFNTGMQQAFLSKCTAAENRSYYLFLGRLHEKKGVELLINAYAVLLESLLNNNKKEALPLLVIAGPDPASEFGVQLQQMVEKEPVLKNLVYFTGMLEGDAKWGALYGCEVFILPSHQENFGIAIVEALACGKPALISNKVNIWQEIENDLAGIVRDDTIDGTISLLKTWTDKTNVEKRQASENAKHSYEKNFSISSAAERFVKEIQPDF